MNKCQYLPKHSTELNISLKFSNMICEITNKPKYSTKKNYLMKYKEDLQSVSSPHTQLTLYDIATLALLFRKERKDFNEKPFTKKHFALPFK